MKIIGNINTADKFYIINSNGSIEWVPTLNLAKKYVNNPQYKEWFEKDIYATNEKLIINENGITVLKSQFEEEKRKKEEKNFKELFKKQAEEYLEHQLLNFSTFYGYDNIYTMISWKDSSIKKYKDEAKLAIKYRDDVYLYFFDYINNKLEIFLKENSVEKLEALCSIYIENFPRF